jgi:pimeloyl-ACP methyl ester carboxylesterase
MSIVRAFLSFLLLLTTAACPAQTFTARPNTSINANCNGFYEYLPLGYDAGGANLYPLIIAAHGLGERGNGGSELNRLVIPGKGLAALLNTGTFPASFTVGGQTFRFVIICPQFTDNGAAWPEATDLEAVINYAVANYRVDITRIYLTGLSMGGGLSYRYATTSSAHANRIAALVPICPAIQPGPPYAARPDSLTARTITAANLPLWTTHNLGDGVVPSSFTDSLTHYVNAAPAPAVPAVKTIFTSWIDAHDAWTPTYAPSFTNASGQNIYQWMLQYRRSLSVLPTTVTRYRVSRSGNSVLVEWASASEDAGDRFQLERSANGQDFRRLAGYAAQTNGQYRHIDQQPMPGRNLYRLTLIRANGQKQVFATLSIDIQPTATLRISHPDPGSMAFVYASEETGAVRIMILDERGSRVQEQVGVKTGKELVRTIDLGGLGRGTYLLQVAGSRQKAVKQFLR